MHPIINLSLPLVKKNIPIWLVFGEHLGDATTHKLLDSSSNKITYRSDVQPADALHPNKYLLTDLGESVGSNKPNPITFVKSHQDHDKSVSKPIDRIPVKKKLV